MDFTQKWDIIHRSYGILSDLLTPIEACRSAHLSPDFLQKNRIVLSKLEWHPENTIDFEPRFCEPCPVAEFETLFKRTKATNYWGTSTRSKIRWLPEYYEEERDESSRRLQKSKAAYHYLLDQMGSPDYPLHMAAKRDWLPCLVAERYKERGSRWKDGSPTIWGFFEIMRALPWPQAELPTEEKRLLKIKLKLRGKPKSDIPIALNKAYQRPGKKSKVHMAIILRDDGCVDEERVLRSELIGAIYIIRDGMRIRKNKEEHAIYPVFVHSWSGFHVRILQVHFDLTTNTLMVRKTPYLQIDGPHREDEIKLMLRWMMNTPTGDTHWEDLDIMNKDDLNTPRLPNQPPTPKKSLQCS